MRILKDLMFMPVYLKIAFICLLLLVNIGYTDQIRDESYSRQVSLEGVHNFRDLGGYKTVDGRQVKWGIIYRSGKLNELTENDQDVLNDLAIQTVFDLRSKGEQFDEPTNWTRQGLKFVGMEEYELGVDNHLAILGLKTAADVDARMVKSYEEFPETHKDVYSKIFHHYVDSDAPILFHCTAGKDRTGVAAALLLSALGVPKELIVEDFLLSNDFLPSIESINAPTLPDEMSKIIRSIPPEVLQRVLSVQPSYLEAMFTHLELNFGGVMNYINDELDIDDQELEIIRQKLLF